MDTLILMAGRGSRFSSLNLSLPKPLVPLNGQPLVRWVVENLRFKTPQRYIFVCLQQHIIEFELEKVFADWNIDFQIVPVFAPTEGALCSALLAKDLFLNNELLIANSDQYINFDKDLFYQKIKDAKAGLIMSMNANGPKWSYIKTNQADEVIEVKEKVAISNLGTTGIYYFKQGNLFAKAAQEMMLANDRTNNEFYLAPVYNYMIKSGLIVNHFNVGNIGTEMIGLGTAEDFTDFENSALSKEFKKKVFP